MKRFVRHIPEMVGQNVFVTCQMIKLLRFIISFLRKAKLKMFNFSLLGIIIYTFLMLSVGAGIGLLAIAILAGGNRKSGASAVVGIVLDAMISG